MEDFMPFIMLIIGIILGYVGSLVYTYVLNKNAKLVNDVVKILLTNAPDDCKLEQINALFDANK